MKAAELESVCIFDRKRDKLFQELSYQVVLHPVTRCPGHRAAKQLFWLKVA
jgi:hypothetical protein